MARNSAFRRPSISIRVDAGRVATRAILGLYASAWEAGWRGFEGMETWACLKVLRRSITVREEATRRLPMLLPLQIVTRMGLGFLILQNLSLIPALRFVP
jgi:hypothetical protein